MQVSAGYGDSRKRVLVANSDGLLADDEVVRCMLRISAVADGDAGMQTGFQSMGHTIGFEVFDSVDVEELARDAARQAITKLGARPAPSGSMPVVIKHGTGGVLFHEACGHGLEADLVAKGASVYRGKTGELVASPLVTVVDDGTMAGRVGHAVHRRRGPRRRSATCSSRTACSPTTCGTSCARARRAGRRAATAGGRATCTCRWSG